MKIILKSHSVILLLAIFFMTQTSKAEVVYDVTFSGGAPLDDYQPSIIVPLLTEAFKRNGIEFHAEYHPSLRSLALSNSGMVDGELHRIYEFNETSGGKYPNLIRIESKLLSVWLAAFANRNINIKTWNDLKGYTVIYYRGRKDVKKFLNKVLLPEQIHDVTTDEQAFKMLAHDRADIVISESRQGNQILTSNPDLSEIVEIANMHESNIYAYLHNKHKEIAPKIAETLEEMKTDGTFSIIVNEVNEVFK